MVPVPPAHVTSFLFYKLVNRKLPIHVSRIQTKKGLSLSVNSRALRSYFASRRKKRIPVTYEMRWELACKQVGAIK